MGRAPVASDPPVGSNPIGGAGLWANELLIANSETSTISRISNYLNGISELPFFIPALANEISNLHQLTGSMDNLFRGSICFRLCGLPKHTLKITENRTKSGEQTVNH